MSDLIEREMAIERIEKQKYREPSIGVWKENDRVATVCYDTVIEALKRLPPAELKTGKWIPVRSYEAFGGDEMMWTVRGNPIAFYYCSNCRNDAYAGEDGESLLTKYCPECGAKMEADHETN